MSRLCITLTLGLLLSGCAIPIIGAQGAEEAFARRQGPRDSSGGRRARKPGLTLGQGAPTLPRSSQDCFDALAAAGVPHERLDPGHANGVEMPLRLAGPVGGVGVWTRGRKRAHGILDCRLALRLLSWAPALRDAGVRGIEHYSMYRPGARTARRGRVSGHARGLAIDAARFHLDDGAVVDVLTDWEDRDRGDPPCPLRSDEAAASRLLRGVVCAAVEQQLFQVVLTPHHDRAHGNHVHLELKPDVSWTYVR